MLQESVSHITKANGDNANSSEVIEVIGYWTHTAAKNSFFVWEAEGLLFSNNGLSTELPLQMHELEWIRHNAYLKHTSKDLIHILDNWFQSLVAW